MSVATLTAALTALMTEGVKMMFERETFESGVDKLRDGLTKAADMLDGLSRSEIDEVLNFDVALRAAAYRPFLDGRRDVGNAALTMFIAYMRQDEPTFCFDAMAEAATGDEENLRRGAADKIAWLAYLVGGPVCGEILHEGHERDRRVADVARFLGRELHHLSEYAS